MSSLRRLISSRANAKLSTGPRTEAGKRRSSQNARRHGCRSRTVIIPEDESREDFALLLQTYLDDLQPRNPEECACINQMAVARWRQRTLWALETRMLNEASLLSLLGVSRFTVLSRYETHESLNFYRALRKFQKLRKTSAICTNELTLAFPYVLWGGRPRPQATPRSPARFAIKPVCPSPRCRPSVRPVAHPAPDTLPTASPHRSPTGAAKSRGNHEH
jgi:hypothetical protein